jgi:hypothetical protein
MHEDWRVAARLGLEPVIRRAGRLHDPLTAGRGAGNRLSLQARQSSSRHCTPFRPGLDRAEPRVMEPQRKPLYFR